MQTSLTSDVPATSMTAVRPYRIVGSEAQVKAYIETLQNSPTPLLLIHRRTGAMFTITPQEYLARVAASPASSTSSSAASSTSSSLANSPRVDPLTLPPSCAAAEQMDRVMEAADALRSLRFSGQSSR